MSGYFQSKGILKVAVKTQTPSHASSSNKIGLESHYFWYDSRCQMNGVNFWYQCCVRAYLKALDCSRTHLKKILSTIMKYSWRCRFLFRPSNFVTGQALVVSFFMAFDNRLFATYDVPSMLWDSLNLRRGKSEYPSLVKFYFKFLFNQNRPKIGLKQ